MTRDPYNPLHIFADALRTIAGWTLVIFATWYAGLWLGVSITIHAPADLDMVFVVLVLSPYVCLFFPQVGIALVVSLVVWYLPLRIDSARLSFGAACANFLAWLGVAIWVGESLRH
jgi:hypothetical protein